MDFDLIDSAQTDDRPHRVIDPLHEAAVWETIWANLSPPTFKQYSDKQNGYDLPSDIEFGIDEGYINTTKSQLNEIIQKDSVQILILNSGLYPTGLNKLKFRSPVLYAKGNIRHLFGNLVSVVGSRKASNRGIKAAGAIANKLTRDGYTVVSGLAEGIDTAAHTETVSKGGKTIAVLGTPINEYYPKKNENLQEAIGDNHLLLSQIPFIAYQQIKKTNFKLLRNFFPERNKVMAALSEATIIIEASDTSGTLIQARECLKMGKKLLLHESVVQNPNSKWAKTYSGRNNVYTFKSYTDIKKALGK